MVPWGGATLLIFPSRGFAVQLGLKQTQGPWWVIGCKTSKTLVRPFYEKNEKSERNQREVLLCRLLEKVFRGKSTHPFKCNLRKKMQNQLKVAFFAAEVKKIRLFLKICGKILGKVSGFGGKNGKRHFWNLSGCPFSFLLWNGFPSFNWDWGH